MTTVALFIHATNISNKNRNSGSIKNSVTLKPVDLFDYLLSYFARVDLAVSGVQGVAGTRRIIVTR
jgi:hypothetical protein